jgi:IS1 family transposase
MLPIFNSEDSDGASCVRVCVPARGLPLARVFRCFGVLTGSIVSLPPQEEGPGAPRCNVCQAPLPRRLPRLSLLQHQRVCCGPCACAPLVRGQKPARSSQTHRHRGVRLSQPAMPVLRDHRCSDPRPRRRWQAWPGPTNPDVSRPCLPHYVHFQAQHCPVPSENSLAPDRSGAHSASRRAGEHAHTLHECFFRTVHLPYLQLDELRTRLRCSHHVLWLWLAIDPCTKILPVLQLGPRTQHMAHRVIHSLRQILAPGCIPLFTSDGLNLYFYALTAHFGQWLQVVCRGRNVRQWQVAAGLIYGQVKKCYRRRKLTRVMPVMRLGTEEALKSALQGLGLSGRLNTAFIERAPLTVRHGVAALARRTWATSQQASQLLAHLEWWRAYSHGCRVLTNHFAWRSCSHASEVADC